MRSTGVLLALCWVLLACTPQVPNAANLRAVTAIPTFSADDPAALCAAVERHWGQNWPLVLDALDLLALAGATCPDGERLPLLRAAAYVGYGTQLEATGRLQEAQTAYAAALLANPADPIAQSRLARLQNPSSYNPCRAQIAPHDPLPPYLPTTGDFVRLLNGQLTVAGSSYRIQGANYYPRETPFHRFLAETPAEVMAAELDILAASGLNTLRIFLHYDVLFTCSAEGATPNATPFARLDALLQLGAERQLRVIPVLHHAVLADRLYSDAARDARTGYLLARYRAEPAVLAWDVRDQGDQDYIGGAASREQVLVWLAASTQQVRAAAPHHLVTAGWWQNALETAPLVDFVSFQHYGDYESLRQTLANLRAGTSKPLLLAATGYSTYRLNESAQRNMLYQVLTEVAHNDLPGWLVYMAFDYPVTATCRNTCPDVEREIHRYGLFNLSYYPKLALNAIQQVTGIDN